MILMERKALLEVSVDAKIIISTHAHHTLFIRIKHVRMHTNDLLSTSNFNTSNRKKDRPVK